MTGHDSFRCTVRAKDTQETTGVTMHAVLYTGYCDYRNERFTRHSGHELANVESVHQLESFPRL